MQINFLANRFSQYRLACAKTPRNIVMDRSIFSDPIFTKMYYDMGKLKYEEYSVYNNLFKEMIKTLTPPDLIIYLQCSTKNMLDKIKKRGRERELEMPDSYWETLHSAYADYYGNFYYSHVVRVNVDGLDYVNKKDDSLKVVSDIRSILRDFMG